MFEGVAIIQDARKIFFTDFSLCPITKLYKA